MSSPLPVPNYVHIDLLYTCKQLHVCYIIIIDVCSYELCISVLVIDNLFAFNFKSNSNTVKKCNYSIKVAT